MGDYRPRVFLSHSSNTGLVKAVLDELERALRDAGFDSLVDRKDIPVGAEFHKEIDGFMRDCDAAVFVISQRVLKTANSYVFAEVNQLRHRIIGQHFLAVAVYIEGVTPDQLRNTWGPTTVEGLNSIVGEEDPRMVAAMVINALQSRRDELSAPAVATMLGRSFEHVDENALRRAAEQGLASGRILGVLRLQVALLLQQAAPERIVEVARLLAREDPSLKAAQATLNLAFPFTWINVDAARKICAGIVDRRPAALNTSDAGTAKVYLRCGWPHDPIWDVRFVGDAFEGELMPEDLANRVRGMLAHADARFDNESAAMDSNSGVVFVIECRRLYRDILKALEPFASDHVGFVLLASEHDRGWEDVAPELRDSIVLLVPDLDRAQETAAWTWYRAEYQALAKRRDSDIAMMTEML